MPIQHWLYMLEMLDVKEWSEKEEDDDEDHEEEKKNMKMNMSWLKKSGTERE